MTFELIYLHKPDRFAIDRVVETGKTYLFVAICRGPVEWHEYYEISASECEAFLKDIESMRVFVQECREHKHEDRRCTNPEVAKTCK